MVHKQKLCIYLFLLAMFCYLGTPVNTRRKKIVLKVCVFFTSNLSFYESTSSTTSVRVDSTILEEIHVMWS